MSDIHKDLGWLLGAGKRSAQFGQPADSWRNPWPNTPDFPFNYARLLTNAADAGFASAGKSETAAIAVIGAGVAGLTAVRELLRCGYRNITLFESSGRIGGRNYSIRAPNSTGITTYTTYEMGAMRIPYFDGNGALSAYAEQFSITSQKFPDPDKGTGVFYNRGYGPPDSTGKPVHQKPTLDIISDGPDYPQEYKDIAGKVKKFHDTFKKRFGALYTNHPEEFQSAWQLYVKAHGNKSFLEFALSDINSGPSEGHPAGMGMSPAQGKLFGTIGAGDGSWGAFFALSAMYPIRTLMCGFGDKHQLIQGVFPRSKVPPEYGTPSKDTAGETFGNPNPDKTKGPLSPQFLGVQSFAECLMYMPMKSANSDVNGKSPYTLMSKDGHDNRLAFYSRVRVTGAALSGEKKVKLYRSDSQESFDYDAVIDTTTSWAGEMGRGRASSDHNVFSNPIFPSPVWDGYKSSHWITSCKVFVPLKERYWENNTSIPQIIISDTWLQDTYAYAFEREGEGAFKDPGVLLVTYTWEDDALKLIADSQQDSVLSADAVGKLKDILTQTGINPGDLEKAIDTGQPITVIHWMTDPDYRGCAKLYHPAREYENFAVMSYNEHHSANTNYYLAGEAASIYGGWTEPAVRHALDAVLNFLKNDGAEFRVKDFDFDTNYPKYGSNPYNPYKPNPPESSKGI